MREIGRLLVRTLYVGNDQLFNHAAHAEELHAHIAVYDAAVQLGAFNSRRRAEGVWHHLDARDPALFAGRTPEITAVTVRRHVFYRLRVAGFENDAAADKFCGAVAAARGVCTLADF